VSQKRIKLRDVRSIKAKDMRIHPADLPTDHPLVLATKPYVDAIVALAQDDEDAKTLGTVDRPRTEAAVERIAAMPLEDRYTWRVVQMLRNALGDFDSWCITADLATLNEADKQRLRDALPPTRMIQLQKTYEALGVAFIPLEDNDAEMVDVPKDAPTQ